MFVNKDLLYEAYRYISLVHRNTVSFVKSPRAIKRRGDVVGKELIRLDPNKCHNDLTISYDMLQVRKSSNSRNWATCLGTKGFQSGRYFWEIRIDKSQTGHIMIGIGHEKSDLNNFHSDDDKTK